MSNNYYQNENDYNQGNYYDTYNTYNQYEENYQQTEGKEEQKDWLVQYVNGQEYNSIQESDYVDRKMRKYNNSLRIGNILDGLILGYVLSILLYVLLYYGYNQAIIPKDGWSDTTAFIVCGAFLFIFTTIWTLLKFNKYIDNYTVGTVVGVEEMNRHDGIIWVRLPMTELPITVEKSRLKNYEQNDRVILYSLNKKPNIYIIHMLTKKQRKRNRQQMANEQQMYYQQQNAYSQYNSTQY